MAAHPDRWLAAVALTVAFVASVPHAYAQVKLSKAEEAAALSQAARGKYKEKRFKVCAAMYREAFNTDRSQVGYLYSAALCDQKGGNFTAAERDYRKVLGLVTPEHPLAAKAQKHAAECQASLVAKQRSDAARRRAEWQRKQAAAKRARQARARAALAAQKRKNKAAQLRKLEMAKKPEWQRPVGWGAIAAGMITAGVGGWLIIDGMADIESLQSKLDRTDDAGQINGIHRDDAVTAQDDANTKQLGGGAAIAVGVAIASVGAWMLAPDPVKKGTKTSLAPSANGRGLVMTVQF